MYVRQDVQDHVTIMNKALYDNLQDGIDEAKEGVSATQESVGELEKKTNEALMETNKTVETLNRDMAEFEEEVNDNFNTVNENVEEQVSGLKKHLLVFKNKVIETSSFVSDTTYTDYPYKADIQCTGVTSEYVPEVTFSLEDAISGKFAPVVSSDVNTVTIYAKEVPSASITIPSILCTKGGVVA